MAEPNPASTSVEAAQPPLRLEEQTTVPPQSRADAELPRLFGRYRLEDVLGVGGMGTVYLATDLQLNRPVALKIPIHTGPAAKTARARFLREAQAAAALQHPNICPIFDVGEIEGTPYLTMAYVRGEPLSRRINGKPWPPSDAVELVRTLALALQSAHEGGVIHRDLKPGNVIIDDRGEPIVMDFGLARRADFVGGQLTQQGELFGTPAYMPPEQITGDVVEMGPGCDIYSLGVMLYELLTGRVPFVGDLLALVSQVTLDPPLPPSQRRPELDSRLDAICLNALAKKPADRFASMQEFADALSAWIGGAAAAAAMTLRVVGTPFAFRPLPQQTCIRVGRQRRKPGDPADVGNDMVVRVPGSDELSARISRRHFEIQREGEQYFVIDRSKAGTLLNGAPLTPHVPAELGSGDRLTVAGVIELEIVLHGSPAALLASGQVTLPGERGAVLEATCGDIVSME